MIEQNSPLVSSHPIPPDAPPPQPAQAARLWWLGARFPARFLLPLPLALLLLMLLPFSAFAQTGIISGTVSNTTVQPLEYVQVELYTPNDDGNGNINWVYSYGTLTDSSGNYSFESLSEGDYRVGFFDYSGLYLDTYYDGAASLDAATTITLTADETRGDIHATLEDASHIVGTVENINGDPLESIQVTVHRPYINVNGDPDWEYVGSDYTDANGQYDVGGLVAGTYRVGFYDGNYVYLESFYADADNVYDATDIPVPAEDSVPIDMILKVASHIVGTVENSDGVKLESIYVSVHRPYTNGNGDPDWEYVGSDYTDANGQYDVGNLVAGDYRVSFGDDNGNYLPYSHTTSVPAHDTQTVNATLEAASHIVGTVENSDGVKLESIYVSVHRPYTNGNGDPDWEYVGYDYTDANGQYDVGNLVAGDYRVSFGDDNGNYLPYSHTTSVPAHDTQTVNATLEVASHIVGTVENSDGVKLESIYVSVHRPYINVNGDPDWEYVGSDYTDANGQYDVGGLVAGTYRVGFYDGNYVYLESFYADADNVYDATDIPVPAEDSVPIDMILKVASHIVGTVENSDGVKLESIYVSVHRPYTNGNGDPDWEYVGSDYTDANGQYDVGNLVAGDYRVSFGDDNGNYLPYSHTTSVPAHDTQTVNATLEAASHIAGRITDAEDNPLPNAYATALQYNAEGGYWTGVAYGYADENGNYNVGGLLPGDYRVAFYEGSGDFYYWQYYPNVFSAEEGTTISLGSVVTETVNMVMQRAAKVVGTVTDANGAPLDDVNVALYYFYETGPGTGDWSHYTSNYIYEGRNGNFAIGSLSPGTYRLGFFPNDDIHAHEYWENATSVELGQDITVNTSDVVTANAQLALGSSISGVVRNQNGDPLNSVYVTLYARGVNSENEVVTYQVSYFYTEADGAYAFTNLPAGDYLLYFDGWYGLHPTQYYNGKDSAAQADVITLEAGEPEIIDVQLTDYGGIAGRVTDPNGNGVAGVQISAYRQFLDSNSDPYYSCCYGTNAHNIMTDANGNYTITGLDTGSYRVQFYPGWVSSYRTEYYDNVSSLAAATDIPVTLGATVSNIDAQLSAGGTVLGTVTDPSGAAFDSAYVVMLDENGYWQYSTYVSPTGVYTFTGVDAGIYYVRFYDYNYQYSTEYYDNKFSFSQATPITVGLDSLITGINAQLDPVSSITGSVFGPDNAPVADVEVELWTEGAGGAWSVSYSTSTNSQGQYSFSNISAGHYRVEFTSDQYLGEWYLNQSSLENATLIDLQPGTTAPNINGSLAGGATITGTVTDDQNAPLSGTVYVYRQQVEADSSVSWNFLKSRSFSGGAYSVPGLPEGTYRLHFTANCCTAAYYPNATSVFKATSVVVAPQALVPNINMQLARNGAISGAVMDDTNAPITTETISVVPYLRTVNADNTVSWQEQWSLATASDSSGNYQLSNLPVGVYRLQFYDWSYPAQFLGNYYSGAAELQTAKNVTVTAGATTPNINAKLLANGRFEGRVTDDNAMPLSGIRVVLYQEWGGTWYPGYEVLTDYDGNYSMPLTQPGSYRLGFVDPDSFYGRGFYGAGSTPTTLAAATTLVLVDKETQTDIDAVLEEAGSVSGQVTNSNSEMIAGVQVIAYEYDGVNEVQAGTPATTDANGNYQITGLSTGNYKIFFSKPGGDFAYRYYGDSITVDAASDVAVQNGQDTPNINLVLPPAVPPAAQFESTTAQVVNDTATGLPTVSIGRGVLQDIVVVRTVVCEGGDTPTDVQLLGGAFPYLMNEDPVGSGIFKTTVPQSDLELLNGQPLTVSSTCLDPDTSQPETSAAPVGKIVLYDPSGFVTDADTGEAIVGATVRLYNVPGWQPRTGPGDTRPNTCQSHDSKEASDPWSQPAPVALGVLEPVGSGRMSPDLNPQLTNSLGRYAWDVALGCWYVTVEAPGYISIVSSVVGVPPAVEDLDLTMQRSTVAANFSGTPLSGPAPLTVAFTDESVGPVSAWLWSFGDSQTATVQNPGHTYTTPGIYSVSLQVTGPEDSHIFTRTGYIVVTETPITGLSANNDGPTLLGSETQLSAVVATGSQVTYAWNFGDGTLGTGQNPTHEYAAPGLYTAIVTATNSAGVVSASTLVQVNDVPIGTLDLQVPDEIIINQPAQFSVSASDGTNIVFAWDFEGPNIQSSGQAAIAAVALEQANYTFSEPGIYTVTVIASNQAGSKSVTKSMTVLDEAVAGLEVTHDALRILGQSTSFSAQVSAGTNVVYTWDFGDGSSATGQSVQHTYAAAGSYSVEVVASNSNNSESVTVQTVVAPPQTTNQEVAVAGLTISAGAAKLNTPVSLVANITAGTNVSYSWDFGDGGKGTGKQTSHTYTAPGKYTVKVTAKNSINERTTAVQITVAVEPTPDTPITGLTISASEAKLNAPMTFVANIATGTNVSYSWDFGNGVTVKGKQVGFTFTSAGIYTVKVTAKNTVSELTAVTEVKIEEVGGSTVEPISGLSAAGPTQSLVGATVAFNAIIAAGENVLFTWDFGDGNSATGAAVTHHYDAAGVYKVKVTAANELGSQSVELEIVVKHGLWMPMTIR